MKPKINPSYTHVYSSYRSSAKKRKLDFNLSKAEFIFLVDQPCAYCNAKPRKFNVYLNKNGTKMTKSITQEGIDKAWIQISGIDRIRNEQGYQLDNCVPCCTQCNQMKHAYNMFEFIDKIIEIHKHFIQGKE